MALAANALSPSATFRLAAARNAASQMQRRRSRPKAGIQMQGFVRRGDLAVPEYSTTNRVVVTCIRLNNILPLVQQNVSLGAQISTVE